MPIRTKVLHLIAEHKYLSVYDLANLIPVINAKPDNHRRRFQFVLTRLWKNRVLNRKINVKDFEIAEGFVPFNWMYWLSDKGAKMLQARTNTEKSPYSLPHEQDISRAHLAFSKLEGRELYWRQDDLKHTIHPDALIGLSNPNLPEDESTTYFFLEIERSKQGHYREGKSGLIMKLLRFQNYRKTTKCVQEWGFDNFYVLLVLKNEERRQNLLSKLRTILPYRTYMLTTQDLVNNINGKIWLSPKDSTPYSLLEIS